MASKTISIHATLWPTASDPLSNDNAATVDDTLICAEHNHPGFAFQFLLISRNDYLGTAEQATARWLGI